MTRFLSDTLTEASDKLLSAHAPGTGGTWVLFSTPTMTVLAAEGRARGGDAATTSVYYNNGTSTANMGVAATVRRTTTTANESFTGVAARLQTTSGADSRYALYHNGSQLILQKRVAAAASTTLAAVTLSYPVDTDCTVELRVNGQELIGLWNGAQQIAVSDSSIAGAGYAGLVCRLNGRIDSVTADTIAWGVAPADGTHGSSSDASAVGVSYALAPGDGAHGVSSDSGAVGWLGGLAPSDGAHAVSSDGAAVVATLSPPGAGIAMRVGSGGLVERIGGDRREEGIHHG